MIGTVGSDEKAELARAHWLAISPTPPAAACSKIVSPGCTR